MRETGNSVGGRSGTGVRPCHATLLFVVAEFIARHSSLPRSLPSCGFGSVGIGIASSRGNDASTRTATQLAVVTPENGQTGRTTLRIGLALDANESLRIEAVEFSLKGATSVFTPATPIVGHPTEVVANSVVQGSAFAKRQDKFVRFVWNSHFDLDQLQRSGVVTRPLSARAVLRVTARNLSTGELLKSTTDEFFVDGSLVSTVDGGGVGDGSSPASASMLDPVGITNDASGNLYVADTGNHRVRRIVTDGRDAASIETVVGNGFQGSIAGTFPALATSMNSPIAVAPDDAGNLFVAELVTTNASRLRYFERGTNLVSELLAGFGRISSLRMGRNQRLFVADETNNSVWSLDVRNLDPVLDPPVFGDLELAATAAAPSAIAVVDTPAATTLWIAERNTKKVLRKVGSDPAVHVAGGGATAPAVGLDARSAAIGNPSAIAATEQFVFVADLANDRVLCVDVDTFTIVNVVTQVVVGGAPRALQQPAGLTLVGSTLYVVETGDGVTSAGQRGHQVVAVRDATSPAAATVVPFACGDTTKVVAAAIGELATQINGVTLEQTTAGTG